MDVSRAVAALVEREEVVCPVIVLLQTGRLETWCNQELKSPEVKDQT